MGDFDKISLGGLGGDLARLHYRGIFDLDGLYKMMRGWIKNHDFVDFYETLHKAKPPELELEWYGERKESGYIKKQVILSFHFWGLHEIEVVEDGKKKKMNEARFTITFDGLVKTDFEGAWEPERSSIRAKLKEFYHKYIIRNELLGNQYDDLANEIRDLQEQTKAFLGMEGTNA